MRSSSSAPAIKSLNGEMTITIKEKETIFMNQAFPDLLKKSNLTLSIQDLNVKNNLIIKKKNRKSVIRTIN